MHKFTIALTLLVGFTLITACRSAAPHVVMTPSGGHAPATMTVTGNATLEVSPDCADLTLTIVADSPQASRATTAIQQQQRVLVSRLRALGIPPADLTLTHAQLDPIYAPNHDGASPLTVAKYRAQVMVTATTRRFDQIGALMEAGAAAGASAMSVQFRRSDLPALKKQVRELAVRAAREKAADLAQGLGLTLGRVISVAETPNGAMMGTPYAPQVAVNLVATQSSGDGLRGTLQPLTLEVSLGFELGARR